MKATETPGSWGRDPRQDELYFTTQCLTDLRVDPSSAVRDFACTAPAAAPQPMPRAVSPGDRRSPFPLQPPMRRRCRWRCLPAAPMSSVWCLFAPHALLQRLPSYRSRPRRGCGTSGTSCRPKTATVSATTSCCAPHALSSRTSLRRQRNARATFPQTACSRLRAADNVQQRTCQTCSREHATNNRAADDVAARPELEPICELR